MANVTAGNPTIVACTFLGNSTDGKGGAVYFSASDGVFTNCVFLKNVAQTDGGAIAVEPNIVVSAHNCLFSGNMTGGDGGAAFIPFGSPLPSLS